MFYKTEEYEGFLVVKYHCIRKTYCLNLQRRALLSVIFYSENVCIKFLLNVGIHLSTKLI